MKLLRPPETRLASLPEAASVRLQDENGERRALAVAVRYSPTQAYCALLELDDQLLGKQVQIEKLSDDENAFRIIKVEQEQDKIDRRLMPIYIQAHTAPRARLAVEHLLDEAGERALGVLNLDLKKNLTIDLWEESSQWRDNVGFIVTDRLQFLQLTLPIAKLIPMLQPSSDVALSAVDDASALVDYDHIVSGMHRGDFLHWLISSNQAMLACDPKTGGPLGFLIGDGQQGRLFCIYAENMEVADSLFAAWLKRSPCATCQLHVRIDTWHARDFATIADEARRVCRRHTRAVPGNIKWDKVYALNVGLHIL